MSTFDQLVAKYRNLSYGRLTANNPSALQNVISQNNGLLGTQMIPGTGNYFETIPENEMNFIDSPSGRVAQNRFRIDPNTGQIIFGTPGGQLSENTGVYDPSIDYGDPGYAKKYGGTNFDGSMDPIETGTGQIAENRGGGGGNGNNPYRNMTQEQKDRQKLKSGLIDSFLDNKYLSARKKTSKLPGWLGLLDNFFDTSLGDIADDVIDSQPFGVNKLGIASSYTGSSDIDRDPTDYGTPTTGVSASDADLGKGDGSGYGSSAAPDTGVSGVDADTGKFSGGKQKGSKSPGEGGGGGFGGDKGVGQDAGTSGGTGGRRGGAGRY
tara:strand:+ start:838 stop:1806 length:969 start_codon:yes stop_codon:yes gene_type:complete